MTKLLKLKTQVVKVVGLCVHVESLTSKYLTLLSSAKEQSHAEV